jgi:hypothetical protein
VINTVSQVYHLRTATCVVVAVPIWSRKCSGCLPHVVTDLLGQIRCYAMLLAMTLPSTTLSGRQLRTPRPSGVERRSGSKIGHFRCAEENWLPATPARADSFLAPE